MDCLFCFKGKAAFGRIWRLLWPYSCGILGRCQIHEVNIL